MTDAPPTMSEIRAHLDECKRMSAITYPHAVAYAIEQFIQHLRPFILERAVNASVHRTRCFQKIYNSEHWPHKCISVSTGTFICKPTNFMHHQAGHSTFRIIDIVMDNTGHETTSFIEMLKRSLPAEYDATLTKQSSACNDDLPNCEITISWPNLKHIAN